MDGANAHAAKAKTMQQKTDRRFMKNYPKTSFDFRFDISAPPAYELACRCLRYHGRNLFFLLFVQKAFGVAFRAIVKPCQPFPIVAMNPIAQRLPIHACRFGRTGSIHAVQNIGNPQDPTCR